MQYSEKMGRVKVWAQLFKIWGQILVLLISRVTWASPLGFLNFHFLILKSHEAIVSRRNEVYRAHGMVHGALLLFYKMREDLWGFFMSLDREISPDLFQVMQWRGDVQGHTRQPARLSPGCRCNFGRAT